MRFKHSIFLAALAGIPYITFVKLLKPTNHVLICLAMLPAVELFAQISHPGSCQVNANRRFVTVTFELTGLVIDDFDKAEFISVVSQQFEQSSLGKFIVARTMVIPRLSLRHRSRADVATLRPLA